MIDNFVNKLEEKYGYTDELCDFLKQLIPTLVNYYGDDKLELILNALDNCEIFLNKKGLSGENRNIVDINVGNVNFKYTISIYPSLPECKSTLIHEICHLIKDYNRYTIDGDNVISYCGLLEQNYKYNSKEKEYDYLSSKHTMFEEMFNEYDTLQIDNMLGIKCPGSIYMFKGNTVPFIENNHELYHAVRQSQFYDPKSWLEFIPEEIKDEVMGMYNVEGNNMDAADDFMKFICKANEKQSMNRHSK